MTDDQDKWVGFWPRLARQGINRPEVAHLRNDPGFIEYIDRQTELTAMMVFRTFITHPDFAMYWAEFCWRATNMEGENPFIQQVEAMVGYLGVPEIEPSIAEHGAWAYQPPTGDRPATVVCGVCVKFKHDFETDPGKAEAVRVAAELHDQSSCTMLPDEPEPPEAEPAD